MSEETGTSPTDPFAQCRARFETLLCFLEGDQSAAMSHSELERRVGLDGREVQRLALQGHLDRRADSEQRIDEVTDAGGVARGAVEADHERVLTTASVR